MGPDEDCRFGDRKMIFQFYPQNEKSSSETGGKDVGGFKREEMIESSILREWESKATRETSKACWAVLSAHLSLEILNLK